MNTNEQTIHQMGLGITNLVKQATGRESVSSIDMDWVSVEQLARYIYGSGSGGVVSFDTNIPDAIESLIAYINAVQDLHGYDNPWPAGGGKNILPLTITNIKALNTSGTWNGNVYTENDLTFTCSVNSDGDITSIAVSGTASANTFLNIVSSALSSFLTDGTVYAINGCPASGSNSTYELQVRIGSASYRDDYGSGTNLTFDASADSSSSKVRIVIYTGTEMANKVYYPMIRLSSVTNDSFAPYSNICPITGWTGCNVIQCGKNLIGTGTLYAADTLYSVDGAASVNSNFDTYRIKSIANKKYTISVIPADTNMCVRVLQFNNAMSFDSHITSTQGTANTRKSVTITSPGDGWLIVSVRKSATDQMIELGETATDFEEYQGEVYAFTFPDESGTVYGGTLDVLSGVLNVTHKSVTFTGADSENWSYSGEQQKSRFRIDIPDAYVIRNVPTVRTPVLCNIGNFIDTGIEELGCYIYPSDPDSPRFAYCPPIPYTMDAAAFKTWLQSNNLQIVYEIAEPLSFQLTAQEVEALVGQTNTIFADTGNVSVQYKVKEDLV